MNFRNRRCSLILLRKGGDIMPYVSSDYWVLLQKKTIDKILTPDEYWLMGHYKDFSVILGELKNETLQSICLLLETISHENKIERLKQIKLFIDGEINAKEKQMRASIANDRKDFLGVQQDLQKVLLSCAQSKMAVQKDVLASNFKQEDQPRYQQFWSEKLPSIATLFSELSKRDIPIGIAKEMYVAVAKARAEVAVLLNQKAENSNIYGHFRQSERGRYHDIVSQGHERFHSFYQPLLKKINALQDNKGRVIFSEVMETVDGRMKQVELSHSFVHDVKNQDKIIYDPASLGRFEVSRNYENPKIIVMWHASYSDIETIFHRIDPLVKEVLNSDSANQENFYFLLGNILWYLGNALPLGAGSAAASENFINAILLAKGFSEAKFQLYAEIPWYFDVKVTPRLEFVKYFPCFCESLPQLVQANREEAKASIDGPSSLPAAYRP
jgi:hypothetical protein